MDDEFEIPSEHEHAVEHAAEHGKPMGQEIALFSAVLATVGAIVSFLGGHTQNDALYYKNEAVLMKARASDDWAYFQSEEIKARLAQVAPAVTPDARSRQAVDVARYTLHAAALRSEAEDYDRKSERANAESEKSLEPHIKLAIAMTFIQIAIALASITALTRRKWLLWGAFAAAAVGILLGTIAWF